MATLIVATLWERYFSNPTQIHIESNHEPIGNLPLPAITFCHASKIDVNRTMNFFDTLYAIITFPLLKHEFDKN